MDNLCETFPISDEIRAGALLMTLPADDQKKVGGVAIAADAAPKCEIEDVGPNIKGCVSEPPTLPPASPSVAAAAAPVTLCSGLITGAKT
jgi:hypothetical protein